MSWLKSIMAYVADITVSVPLTKLVLTSRQKLGGCRNGIGSDATAPVLYWHLNVSNPCILLSVVHLVNTIMHAVSSKKRCPLCTRQMYQTTGEWAPFTSTMVSSFGVSYCMIAKTYLSVFSEKY